MLESVHVPTIRTPTFLQPCIRTLYCIPVSCHLSLYSDYLVQYPDLVTGTSLLARTEGLKTSHCFKHCFTMIKLTVHLETVSFLLFSRCEKALIFVFWSCFLIKKNNHILKVARSVV